MKKDKKKEKRLKKKANKEAAKQAKTFNRFGNDGDFLKKYLEKSGQPGQSTLGKRDPDDDSGEDEDSKDEESLTKENNTIDNVDQKNDQEIIKKDPKMSTEKEICEAGESPQKIKVIESKE